MNQEFESLSENRSEFLSILFIDLHWHSWYYFASMLNHSTAKASFYFVTGGDLSLESVSFFYDQEIGELKSLRGRSQGVNHNYHSFLWSPAVRALAVLILKTCASTNTSDEEVCLIGEDGSLASTLDYSLGKNTAWISDMFGCDIEGVPYARQIFLRMNPERKRPGPVMISVNPQILRYDSIKIYLDGVEVREPKDLLSLAKSIEDQHSVRKGSPGEYRLKSVVSKADLKLPDLDDSFGPPRQKISTYVSNFQVFTTSLDLEQDLLRCLRSRVIERKFGFLGPKSAEAWADLCSSGRYSYFHDDLALIKSVAPKIAEHIHQQCQVISVWPGTGHKELAFLQAMRKNNDATLTLLDSSQKMLSLAIERLEGLRENADYYIADFMQSNILSTICSRVRRSAAPNVLTFFGNTLGSHSQSSILQIVRSALARQDYVLFGVQASAETDIETDKELQKILEQYESPEFRRVNLSSLNYAGIDPAAGAVEIESRRDRFFPALWIIETYFRFTKEYRLQYNGDTIFFSEGERIQLSAFYQYTLSMIDRILHGQGFNVVQTFSSPANCVLLLCQPDK